MLLEQKILTLHFLRYPKCLPVTLLEVAMANLKNMIVMQCDNSALTHLQLLAVERGVNG